MFKSKQSLFPNGKITIGRMHPYWPIFWNVDVDMNANMHAMIIGASRSGKSRLLQSRFMQVFRQGGTIGILEPHYDLSMDTLTSLIKSGLFKDESAYEKLVYLDFNNGSYTPLNIFAGNREKILAEDLAEISTSVELALEIFLRLWPALEDAPLFRELFTACAHVCIVNFLPITSMYQLLIDSTFRAECLKKVKDPVVRMTIASYDRMRPTDQLESSGSLRRRLQALAYNPVTRLTLSQPECLDFRKMIDDGVSFILNLGSLRSRPIKRIMGVFLLCLLEQAALSRTDIQVASRRRPVRVLVDEWPAFAAQNASIADILSQAAKYKFYLDLACQTTSQISAHGLMGAMENCRQMFVFGVGVGSADDLSSTMTNVDPRSIKEEALTESQHNIFESYTDQIKGMMQALRDQPPRIFTFKQDTKVTERLRTIDVPDVEVDPDELEEILATYRRIYQRSAAQVKPYVDSVFPPTLEQADEHDMQQLFTEMDSKIDAYL